MAQAAGGRLAQAEREFDPRNYLRILRRRYPYLLVPAVLISAVVYWIATVLPPVYQARATILVESQQIPTSLARSTVTANADERIQTIQQRLMTRDNILTIARKFNLYADQRNLSPTEIVDQVRSATKIRQIDVGGRASQSSGFAIGFTVSFDSPDPSAAAKVTNELVGSILEQNIQARTQGASETSKFFDQQLAQLQTDLAAQEARIVDFKRENKDALPETLNSRQAILVQQMDLLASLRQRIDGLQSERQTLTRQDGIAIDPAADSTASELARLRLQLVQLKAVYSDTHPEVKAVTARIAALEKASSSAPLPGGSPATTASIPPSSAGTPSAAAPPAASPAPSSLNARRVADIDVQLEALNKQVTDIDARTRQLDASVQKTPEVEVALNVLMRDHDNLQAQYRSVSAKAAEAATGQQLEQDQQAERFAVIESASVPGGPISPDRKRIMIAGVAGGIAVGIGLVMLLEFLDQSIRSVADLQSRLHIRPIASIPYVTTAAETRRRRRRRFAIPGAAIAAALVLVVALQMFYSPLDQVAQKVVQRLGF